MNVDLTLINRSLNFWEEARGNMMYTRRDSNPEPSDPKSDALSN